MDTIVVCTFTALVILSTGIWELSADGNSMALLTYTDSFGTLGTVVLSLSLFLFASTSAIGMGIFMERHVTAIFGKMIAKILVFVYLGLMVAGGWVGFGAVVPFTDTSTALNIFINVTGLVLMSGVLRTTTKEYFADYAAED